MKSRIEFPTAQEYREYLRTCFAGLAMQGIISGIYSSKEAYNSFAISDSSGSNPGEKAAIKAINLADELLNQLENSK